GTVLHRGCKHADCAYGVLRQPRSLRWGFAAVPRAASRAFPQRPVLTGSGGSSMSEPLPLKSIHHVELLVGNAKQAAFYYRKAFGFSQLAYAGPETGVRDQASYVLEQGKIRLVVSTPLFPEDPMADYLKRH